MPFKVCGLSFKHYTEQALTMMLTICVEGSVSRGDGSGCFIMWKTRHFYLIKKSRNQVSKTRKKKLPVILPFRTHYYPDFDVCIVNWSYFFSSIYIDSLSLKKVRLFYNLIFFFLLNNVVDLCSNHYFTVSSIIVCCLIIWL